MASSNVIATHIAPKRYRVNGLSDLVKYVKIWFSLTRIFWYRRFCPYTGKHQRKHAFGDFLHRVMQWKFPTLYWEVFTQFKLMTISFICPVSRADTGSKLNVHQTFRRRPRRLPHVLCTLSLRPVSTGSLF